MEHFFKRSQLLVSLGIDSGNGFSRLHLGSELFMENKSHSGIDAIRGFLSAATQVDEDLPDLPRIEPRDVSAALGFPLNNLRRQRKQARIVDHGGVASLRLDHLPKNFEGRPVFET